MNAKEKYNTLINKIESLIREDESNDDPQMSAPHFISDTAFESAGCSHMDDRSKNVLFLFLNGRTVIDYIQERKMVWAYSNIVHSECWNRDLVDRVIEIVGVSDDKAFAKKFKRQFGTSPKKAFIEKRLDLISKPRDWDEISKDGKSMFINLGEKDMKETKFGVNRELFIVANAAADLQAFYTLTDEESEFAYSLFAEKDIPLNESFEYVYNYLWSSFEDEDRGNRLREDLLNPDIMHMYFKCGMTFNEIALMLITFSKSKLPKNVSEATKEYLLFFREYVVACKSFYENKDIAFDDLFTFFQNNSNEKSNIYMFKSFMSNVFTGLDMKRAIEKSNSELKADDSIYALEYEDFVLSEDFVFSQEYNEMIDDYDDRFHYEPDMDNPEEMEDLYMNHDRAENYNINTDFMEDSWEEFNAFCDTLDHDEKEPAEGDRRLRGYKNLNITDMLAQIEE